MLDGRTTVRVVVAALLAMTALSESTRHGDLASDWWPCRVAAAAAAGRRRYDDDGGGGNFAHGDEKGGGTEEGTEEGDEEGDKEGGGGGDEEGGGGGGGVGDGYAAPHVAFMDDKRKRGVRVPAVLPGNRVYDKNRPPGNGLRVDPSLLRGETVELSTYVNVPVTLRCKFVPLEGTDSKFETVVEAMYPGHADVDAPPSPPPQADSHATRIIKQLVGSVDGWRRNVVGKSTRPVRRVVDNYYGRRAAADLPPELEQRSPRFDDSPPWFDDGVPRFDDSPPRFDNGVPRWRAAERLQRVRAARPGRYGRRWQTERQHMETVDGQVEPDNERTPHHRSGSFEYRTFDDQLIEPVDDQLIERVDDQVIESTDDRAAEEVDDRPADGEELNSIMSDINTTVEPDYANFDRSDPTSKTFTGNGITTPSV